MRPPFFYIAIVTTNMFHKYVAVVWTQVSFLEKEVSAEAEMMMAPPGSNSPLFTYTSDLADDSASSGRSRSTASSVNQPLPGEQAMPPAPPVMQEAANRAPPKRMDPSFPWPEYALNPRVEGDKNLGE
ncbi:hypothetical protein SORBI_3008G029600 [Sorghum bicolor]|uniref:Uncharacterized protein n=1 Tax=Sorghum bicolor TaxID=4558 RepID=A0A1B6PBF1_SORBI|nr:hypothetical protein SORBI_3008G029600 [Sorghum bicolor]